MSREADFKARAEEAERLMKRAIAPAERDAYERIAKGWRDLQDQAKRDARRGF